MVTKNIFSKSKDMFSLKSCSSNYMVIKAIVLCYLGLSMSVMGFGQVATGKNSCGFDISHKVEKSQTGSDFTISIKIDNAFGNAEIKLVDFRNSSKGILDKKSISLQDFSQDYTPVFSSLKPSTYIVQIYVEGKCMVSVNGMDGIEIKDN